ncbi:EsaB/YukD family protein [Mycolicibacterium porcinum]|uniref:EsaB/YukD family protein n=1 Tax=Mycolicibacterium porcinum TaxID=39693 RepID=A0ABV3VS42_9MYCO
MTGVEELRPVHVVSAAPEAIRVSVVGGRTQLDVALPADVPVAAFLPELARLIKSRDDAVTTWPTATNGGPSGSSVAKSGPGPVCCRPTGRYVRPG